MTRSFGLGLLVLVLAAVAPAQRLGVAVNDGLPINTTTSGASSWFCIQVTAPPAQMLPILGIEFLMRPGGPAQNFAIYDQDVGTGKPNAQIALGSFNAVPYAIWQGGLFRQPVLIQPGQTFFIGVDNTDRTWGNQLLPIVVGGVQQIHYWNPPGWSGPFSTQPWAYRLYLPGGGGSMSTYGTGSSGSVGQASLIGLGWPNSGNPIGLLARDVRAGSAGFLALGQRTPGLPVAPFGTVYALPIWVSLPVMAEAASSLAHLGLSIPNDPFLLGGRLAGQFWFLDASGPGGLVHTGGLEIVLGS